jgi:putative hydrolases of HD superfamily
MNQRLKDQIQFLVEIDKVKHVLRRTRLLDNSRYENDAEHCWHLAIMAIVLEEYANDAIDVGKVVKMVLIHDLVEIDAGDTFLYDSRAAVDKGQREREAAGRIYALLPEEQGGEFAKLWEEFERKETPEAKYACALDRLEPLIQNVHTAGHAWKKHGIRRHQVVEKNKPVICNGSELLWKYAEQLINDSVNKGYLEE